MRPILLSLLFAGLLIFSNTTAIYAQTITPERAKRMKDGIIRQGGQLYIIEKGTMAPLQEEMEIGGATVQPDGTVILANGKKQKLREGYAVNRGGNIVITKDDMFTSSAINSYANETIGSTSTEFVITDEGTTVINAEKRQTWQHKLNMLEKKMTLLNQMMDLQAKKMEKMSSSEDLSHYDEEIRELNAGIETINQKLASK